jgi:hypothetical protein
VDSPLIVGCCLGQAAHRFNEELQTLALLQTREESQAPDGLGLPHVGARLYGGYHVRNHDAAARNIIQSYPVYLIKRALFRRDFGLSETLLPPPPF